jgi:hypothetical protein
MIPRLTMLRVILLRVILPSVIMLSIMLSILILSVKRQYSEFRYVKSQSYTKGNY